MTNTPEVWGLGVDWYNYVMPLWQRSISSALKHRHRIYMWKTKTREALPQLYALLKGTINTPNYIADVLDFRIYLLTPCFRLRCC